MNPKRLDWQYSSIHCLSPDTIITIFQSCAYLIVTMQWVESLSGAWDSLLKSTEIWMPWFVTSNIWAGLVFMIYCLFSYWGNGHFCGPFSKVLWLWGVFRLWRRSDEAKIAFQSHENITIFINSKYWIWFVFWFCTTSVYKAISLREAKGRRDWRSQKVQGQLAISIQKGAAILGGSYHTSQKAEAFLRSHSCCFVLTHWFIRVPWKQWSLAF